MSKTIWILGAGASIGNMKGKFPSILDFFSFARSIGFLSISSKITEDKFYELIDTVSCQLKENLYNSYYLFKFGMRHFLLTSSTSLQRDIRPFSTRSNYYRECRFLII